MYTEVSEEAKLAFKKKIREVAGLGGSGMGSRKGH